MAVINIKLSQAAIDLESEPDFDDGPLGSLSDVVDLLVGTDYLINANYQDYLSVSWTGSTLTFSHADGSTETYTGVVRADPAASKGTATATGYQFYQNGQLSIAETGTLSLNYDLSAPGGLSLSNGTSSTLKDFKLTTLLPTSSPLYDDAMGNVSLAVNGSVTADATGNFNGTLTKITGTAEKLISSIVIDGSFAISGNAMAIGIGQASASASGTMTGYTEEYRDGSYARVSGISTQLTSDQVVNASLLAEAARFGGDDQISIDLPGKLFTDFVMASGAGNDHLTLKGGGGRLNVDAGSGNDTISIASDAHRVDGGAGRDSAAMPLARSSYTVTKTADGFTVKDSGGTTNTLVNVERITFADANVALDVAGNAGQVYRTYQAAFDRVPDSGGLGFWMHFMDNGFTLPQVAAGFMAAPEFKAMYGENPSHVDFVNKLYLNVLHRPGEASGVKFYLDALEAGLPYANVLAFFAESPENQAAVIGVIGNGFSYTPYAG